MHWFWRAAIAVLVGCVWGPLWIWFGAPTLNVVEAISPDLVAIAFSPAWYRNPPLVAALAVIDYGPAGAIAVTTYAVLTRCFDRRADGTRETRCRECGYILRGITEPRCPECGERI